MTGKDIDKPKRDITMIDKKNLIKFILECIYHQKHGSDLNFLELIIFKINEGHFEDFRDSEKCKWEITNYKLSLPGKIYKIECNPDILKGFLKKASLMGYKYCNYCGKEIEEIENE